MLQSIDDAIAKGMGRAVTVGSLTTPVGGGTVLLLAQPMVAVGIPAGFAIRPFFISIAASGILVVADADEVDVAVTVDTKGYWQGSGTFTNEVVANLRTDLGPGSACRAGSVFTADLTTVNSQNVAAAPVADIELDHAFDVADLSGTAANAHWRKVKLLYEPNYPPYIVGPATLFCQWGGTTAVTAFASVQWIEGRYRFVDGMIELV